VREGNDRSREAGGRILDSRTGFEPAIIRGAFLIVVDQPAANLSNTPNGRSVFKSFQAEFFVSTQPQSKGGKRYPALEADEGCIPHFQDNQSIGMVTR
jgi:hypothetical protein